MTRYAISEQTKPKLQELLRRKADVRKGHASPAQGVNPLAFIKVYAGPDGVNGLYSCRIVQQVHEATSSFTEAAGSGTDTGAGGTVAWSNPTNITADDSSYASATLNAATTNVLRSSSHAFAVTHASDIPTDATIVGITVKIKRSKSGSGTINGKGIRLCKAGSPVGDTLTDPGWSIGETEVTLTGSTNGLWGTTWTPAEVRASGFGVQLQAEETAGSSTQARVQYVEITVSFQWSGWEELTDTCLAINCMGGTDDSFSMPWAALASGSDDETYYPAVCIGCTDDDDLNYGGGVPIYMPFAGLQVIEYASGPFYYRQSIGTYCIEIDTDSGLVADEVSPGRVRIGAFFNVNDGTTTVAPARTIVFNANHFDVTSSSANVADVALLTQMSITTAVGGAKLVNDATSPGNTKYYGTDSGGTKGWYTLTSGSGTVTSIVAGTGLSGGTITTTGTIALDINSLSADDIDVADSLPYYDSSGSDTNKITVKRLAGYIDPAICDFRLTPQTGQAVRLTNFTSIATLYMTPYQAHVDGSASGYGRIALYDGTRWNLHLTAEISLSLTLTASTVYDVFVYDNSGTLTLELTAWSTATSRATNVDYLDGVLVKSGSTTRRYMGTIYAVGTNITEFSTNRMFIWNYYHRHPITLYTYDSTDSWNYTTATWRSANNSAANRIEFVIGIREDIIEAQTMVMALSTSAKTIASGIGVDSTSVNSALLFGTNMSVNQYHQVESFWKGFTNIGYHFLQWLEYSGTGGTTTWYGDGGVPSALQGGIMGKVWG